MHIYYLKDEAGDGKKYKTEVDPIIDEITIYGLKANADNESIFYIKTGTTYFVQVNLPQEAIAFPVGSASEKVAKVIIPSWGNLIPLLPTKRLEIDKESVAIIPKP